MLLLGFLVSAGALWVAFRGLDPAEILRAIGRLSPGPLAAALATIAAGYVLRALRWHVLLRRAGATLAASAESVLVSTFATGVLPFRAGEAARVLYLSRRTDVPLAAASAALVLERVLDLAALASMGAFVVSTPGAAGTWPRTLGLAVAALVTCLGALQFLPRLAARLSASGRHPRLGRLAEQLCEGIAALASPKDAALVVGLSAALWGLAPWASWWVFTASGTATSWTANATILLATCAAVALPSSPGFIGTFHGGFVLAATALGLPRSISAPAAIVTHALGQVPFIVAGAVVLAWKGRDLLSPPGPVPRPPLGG